MTLVASGILNLKGSSAAPTRSIEFECEGNYTSTFTLLTAQGIAAAYVGTLPTGMTDFYGYSACSDPTPGAIATCVGGHSSNYLTVTYGTSSNADNYRLQWSPEAVTNWQPSSGGGAEDAVSPFTFTEAHGMPVVAGDYKVRVAGENCSGLGAYKEDPLVIVL